MAGQTPHNFGSMTDKSLVEFGLNAVESSFVQLSNQGLISSLYISAGLIINDNYLELGFRALGPDAMSFSQDVSAKNGKLATVRELAMDSITASRYSALTLEGARGEAGGVYYTAMTKTNGIWRECVF